MTEVDILEMLAIVGEGMNASAPTFVEENAVKRVVAARLALLCIKHKLEAIRDCNAAGDGVDLNSLHGMPGTRDTMDSCPVKCGVCRVPLPSLAGMGLRVFDWTGCGQDRDG